MTVLMSRPTPARNPRRKQKRPPRNSPPGRRKRQATPPPAKPAGKKRASPAAKSPAPAASTGPASPAQTSAPDSAARTAAAPQGNAAFSAKNASDSPSPTGRGGGRHGEDTAPAGKQPSQSRAEATPPPLTHNPQTGEVFGPAAGLITCPNTGRQVDELDCTAKSCREGCPVFEF